MAEMTPCEYTLNPQQSVTIRLSLGFPVGTGKGYWYIAQATGDPFKSPEEALAAYNAKEWKYV